jgi:hypothetical protein
MPRERANGSARAAGANRLAPIRAFCVPKHRPERLFGRFAAKKF